MFKAAVDYISENSLGSPTSDEIQDVTSSLKQKGISEPEDLKRVSQVDVKFLVEKDLKNDTKGFLDTLNVRKTDPVNLDESVRLLGAGFNILTEKTTPSVMFTYETKNTQYGVIVPAPARFSKCVETHTFMENFESTENWKIKSTHMLNVSHTISLIQIWSFGIAV